MNTKRAMLGVAAAGAIAVGVLAVPAVAGAGPFGDDSPGMGIGMGRGTGMGTGAADGLRMGASRNGTAGTCAMIDGVAQGTLTEAEKSTLQAMAEEEKLAGDLYQAFAGRYPAAAVFERIAAAEDQHLAAVRTLLDRYGLADPTAGQAAGAFTTASVQATYDRLLAQGLQNQTAALAVGRQVEQADIAALQQAATSLDAPDVLRVYQHLLAASRQHLAAFTAWPAR